ncbi:UDP-N-acetylglucosamine transferase subunit ALG14 homolog [Pseudomyrmex gracilis]|uniref:UDP-N-acetylglucosamine transferase subunit ALG14 homolog n=1 Tax=Pseudomyrmex gracilis TaxID=219809 RepID=UPI0009952A50|nr:UDP-N-acetylglucosamine transferase subunit ALG14 homolog [Pseudomyrmex gracilis]XP_020290973.1 UDP-N-acetylglucosamine transferase subunit ALG14 homolog [Pseudomyrmex gracilis]
MYTLSFVLYVALVCCALIFVRLYFLIFMKRHKPREKSSSVKTMIILGSGGHTAEMLRIVQRLNVKNYSPRVYVHAQTDKLSSEKVRDLETGNKDYNIVDIYRSREVRQSYFTSVWTTVLATLNSISILWRERPELILCNGPGTCVPLCVVAFLLKALCFSQTVIVFIESFCRVKTFSLTGKILYYLADYVIVQWAYLSKPVYSRSIFL